MSFTSAILGEVHVGNRRMSWGSYTTSSTETGGDITTGLAVIECFQICPNKSSVTANQVVVNETFPLNVDGVTIVQDASLDGYWMAIGQ